MKTKRKNPIIRKNILLCTAIKLSIKVGYRNLTRDALAKKARVSPALINHYFFTIDQLKEEILKQAIKLEIVEIIAQALGARDLHKIKISEDLKQKTLSYLSNSSA